MAFEKKKNRTFFFARVLLANSLQKIVENSTCRTLKELQKVVQFLIIHYTRLQQIVYYMVNFIVDEHLTIQFSILLH